MLLLDGWQEGRTERPWASTPRWLLLGGGALLVAAVLFPLAPPWSAAGPSLHTGAFGALLGIAILGLLLVEQLYRRTPAQGRWAVKPIVI